MDSDKKETLRLRFSVNGIEIELEGIESSVLQQFDMLFEKATSVRPTAKTNDREPEKVKNSKFAEKGKAGYLSTLRDLRAKKVTDITQDWTLIHVYLLTKQRGKETFTYDDIRSSFKEEGKYTRNFGKSISGTVSNFIKKSFAKSEGTKNTYILTDAGRDAAQKIIARGDNG